MHRPDTAQNGLQLPRHRVDPARLRVLREGPFGCGPVIYWMSRDQRARDNWALVLAQDLARALDRPLAVCFGLTPAFAGACLRHYAFMLAGLEEAETELASKGIPLWVRAGDPADEVPRLVREQAAAALVCDFDPLRIKQAWQQAVCAAVDVPVIEVDAHNIVPCRFVSDKAEWGAYTLRPKIHRHRDRFLTRIPGLRRQDPRALKGAGVDWRELGARLTVDRSVAPVGWLAPGGRAAARALRRFIAHGLARYADEARDPNAGAVSNLSPYLHFGQIGAQRVALEVQRADAPEPAKAAFLEELSVRRELADNFCLHNPEYDRFACAPEWARKTLDEHRDDRREMVYSYEQLDTGATHDALWNAAQGAMVQRGKMHGYLRMYWAKKILEWSATPEEAFDRVVTLNDRYELDGRDPNGYAGAAWAICGVHDRAWSERPVFGKIRYMNAAGCRRKFDVDRYIRGVQADGAG